MVDNLKLGLAAALGVAGIAAFYLLGDSPAIVRVAAVIVGLVAGVVLALTTERGKQFHAFAQDSVTETKKVVWPTRKEAVQTTGIVFVFVVIMALFLWMVDAALLWVVKLLMGRSD